MSFSAGELQSLNEMLEQKLATHRRDMEHFFDQRLHTLHREMDQRLTAAQQEIMRKLSQKLLEQQSALHRALGEKLHAQQLNLAQTIHREGKERLQQQLGAPSPPELAVLLDRALAAQLLGIEVLLNQRAVLQPFSEGEPSVQFTEHPPQVEAIEVQTELPWEDLMEIFGRALDERFSRLNEATQATIERWEQSISAQIQSLQARIREDSAHARQTEAYNDNLTNMQQLFESIEQLERIIESMQAAMTANHALLSNQLYRHQQLPLERAHASDSTPSTEASNPNGVVKAPPLSSEGDGR